MTTYSNREVVVRRVEFGVEAGSDIGTVNKVQRIAWLDFCNRTGVPYGQAMSDDWCTVHPRDEEVVFAFEVEHKPTDAEQAIVRAREALTRLAEVCLQKSGRIDAADLNPISDALGGAGLS